MPNENLMRADLDDLQCGDPDCKSTHADDPLNLNPICHPDAGSLVSYNRVEGNLTFHCHECDLFIASVVVAAGATA